MQPIVLFLLKLKHRYKIYKTGIQECDLLPKYWSIVK